MAAALRVELAGVSTDDDTRLEQGRAMDLLASWSMAADSAQLLDAPDAASP
ncbi:hypothetical protein [Cellulomonas timonensis]|uniref:hypothetical protein n=1 Tax=Cellulomonas timonensis TaxID=1689271 RepID=UPI00164DB624|nr:hypothetical protein [Cellulomonas timonensis]